MLIAGIDEAGRGPCIGPLVMAVAVADKGDEEKLIELGVKDSKLLSPKERERQYPEIKKILREHRTIQVVASELDSMMERKSLNEIEAMQAAKLLNSLRDKPAVVYVDSPDIVMQDFGKRIEKFLSFPVKIISEHKADLNYPIVSAASVLAKVERDEEIKKISGEFGDIGSGYSHDEDTIRFLRKYLQLNSEFPGFVRKKWGTIRNLKEEKFQKKLF